MTRALDTRGVVLPGVTTPRLLLRLCGILLLSFAGALLAGYAAFVGIFLMFEKSLTGFLTPWKEGALGMMFWPFVLFGTLWAWCWAFALLRNRRWVLAGSWIIGATIVVVMLLTPLSPMFAAQAGYTLVAIGCVLLGKSKLTAVS